MKRIAFIPALGLASLALAGGARMIPSEPQAAAPAVGVPVAAVERPCAGIAAEAPAVWPEADLRPDAETAPFREAERVTPIDVGVREASGAAATCCINVEARVPYEQEWHDDETLAAFGGGWLSTFWSVRQRLRAAKALGAQTEAERAEASADRAVGAWMSEASE